MSERLFVSVAGLSFIMAGTLLSMLVVPEDPAPAGDMLLSAIVMTVALLCLPAARLGGGIMRALRAENLLLLGLVYWLVLDLLQGAYDIDLSRQDARLALLAIGITGSGIWVGANLFRPPVPQFVRTELHSHWSSYWIFRVAVGCFVLGMLTFAIPSDFDPVIMFNGLREERWGAPWSRAQMGGVDAFWGHLQYFGYVLPALYVAYSRQRGWVHPKALAVLVLALVMVAFLSQGGGRRVVGVVVGAAILYWMMSSERVRFKTFMGVALASAALLFFMQLMLLYRSEGLFEQLDVTFSRIHVDDNYLRLGQTIQLVPAEHPYVYHQLIYYTLVKPIPRLFWPGKPSDPGFDLASNVGIPDTSLSISIIGEWYVTLGFTAVALGSLFFGWLCALVNEMMRVQPLKANSVLVPICLMVLFAGMRSLQDLVVMSYAVMGWLLVSAVVNRVLRKRRSVWAQREALIKRVGLID